ncbi:uncharacterized protein FA14DRAFT_192474 [Meira miltonrushii]|uniref:Trichohyalin n=1 Tax=Meira miltonrushii TaxID=1280837 RepID=A0A316V4P7_9BASI|nr:uncharacterized protein FA14DRAFT_192474 [Meira miltonrushii]PWN32234.1 hypothetical protein FA14DRAFT_192474 [Meira miltonrushii]
MTINRFVTLWLSFVVHTALASVQLRKRANKHTGFDLNKSPAAETDSDDDLNHSPNQPLKATTSSDRHTEKSALIQHLQDQHIAREQLHLKALHQAKETGSSYQKAYWMIKKEAFLESMRVNEPERYNTRQEIQGSKRKKINQRRNIDRPKSKYQKLIKLRNEGTITPEQSIELADQARKDLIRKQRYRKKKKEEGQIQAKSSTKGVKIVELQKRGNNHRNLDLNKSPVAASSSDDEVNQSFSHSPEATISSNPQVQKKDSNQHTGSFGHNKNPIDDSAARDNLRTKALQHAKETGQSYQKAYWIIKKQAFLENMRVNDPERWNTRQAVKKEKRKRKEMNDPGRPKNKYLRLLKLRREGKLTLAQETELADQKQKYSMLRQKPSAQLQKRGNNRMELDLNKSPAAESSSDGEVGRSSNQASEAGTRSEKHAESYAQYRAPDEYYTTRENLHFRATQHAKETGISYQKAYWKIKKQEFLENMRVNEPERWNARQAKKQKQSSTQKQAGTRSQEQHESTDQHNRSSTQVESYPYQQATKENIHFRAVQQAKETGKSYQKVYWKIKKEAFLENMRANDPERYNARHKNQIDPKKKIYIYTGKTKGKYNRLLKLRREGKITPSQRLELAQETKKWTKSQSKDLHVFGYYCKTQIEMNLTCFVLLLLWCSHAFCNAFVLQHFHERGYRPECLVKRADLDLNKSPAAESSSDEDGTRSPAQPSEARAGVRPQVRHESIDQHARSSVKTVAHTDQDSTKDDLYLKARQHAKDTGKSFIKVYWMFKKKALLERMRTNEPERWNSREEHQNAKRKNRKIKRQRSQYANLINLRREGKITPAQRSDQGSEVQPGGNDHHPGPSVHSESHSNHYTADEDFRLKALIYAKETGRSYQKAYWMVKKQAFLENMRNEEPERWNAREEIQGKKRKKNSEKRSQQRKELKRLRREGNATHEQRMQLAHRAEKEYERRKRFRKKAKQAKDSNGVEIDLNLSPQKEETRSVQKTLNAIDPASQSQTKIRPYVRRTYTPRTIKKEYSEGSGARRSRLYRERRRQDPQRLERYLSKEQRKQELNEQQSIQLAEYRRRRSMSKERWNARKKARMENLNEASERKE